MSKSWLALSAFCNPKQQNLFLKNCVKPLVAQLESEEVIDRFYFIRFEHPASHVLLRFELREGLFDGIESSLLQKIQCWLTRNPDPDLNPGTAKEPDLTGQVRAFQDGHQWAYIMEPFRYGGMNGFDMAIDLFHQDTKVILEWEEWDHESVAILAMTMHLCFVCGLGLSPREASLLFANISLYWQNYFRKKTRGNISDRKSVEKEINDWLSTFEKEYGLRKPSLMKFFETNFQTAELPPVCAEVRCLDGFYATAGKYRQKLDYFFEAGKLTIPDWFVPAGTPWEESLEKRVVIVQDFFHPINNRLGMNYLSEWRLAELLRMLMLDAA